MKLNKIAAAASAALLLASTAGVAQASSAQSLSVAKNAASARVSTDAGKSNEVVGAPAYVLGAIGLGLVVWGIVELTNDDDPDSP